MEAKTLKATGPSSAQWFWMLLDGRFHSPRGLYELRAWDMQFIESMKTKKALFFVFLILCITFTLIVGWFASKLKGRKYRVQSIISAALQSQTLSYDNFFFLMASPQGMWDLSSLPSDQTHTLCIGSMEH